MEMEGWGTWHGGRNPPFVGWQTLLSFYSVCVLSCSVMSDSLQPHGARQELRLLVFQSGTLRQEKVGAVPKVTWLVQSEVNSDHHQAS